MTNMNSWGDSNSGNSVDNSNAGNLGDSAKVSEIQEGSVVVEIYEKPDDLNNRLFFDLRISREYILRNTKEKKRGPYLHQRDVGDIVIAVMCAQKWINGRVRQFRSENSDY